MQIYLYTNFIKSRTISIYCLQLCGTAITVNTNNGSATFQCPSKPWQTVSQYVQYQGLEIGKAWWNAAISNVISFVISLAAFPTPMLQFLHNMTHLCSSICAGDLDTFKWKSFDTKGFTTFCLQLVHIYIISLLHYLNVMYLRLHTKCTDTHTHTHTLSVSLSLSVWIGGSA